MGRLVDVDNVIKAVDKHTKDKSEVVLDDDISVILEEVPTAYDVEKVVVELKKESYQEFCDSPKIIDLKDAIDIVENGGI